MATTLFGSKSSTNTLLVVVGFSVLIMGVILLIIISYARRSQQNLQQLQQQQAESPETAVQRQVQNVLLRRQLDDGTIVFYEILRSGQVNIYDSDMNLIRSGIQGYYKVDNLFNMINRELDDYDTSKTTGKYALTINTNQGQLTIYIDDDDILDDLVDEVEEIVEEPFLPTPTPAPSATPVPGQPTSTPAPGSSPTPTPLPAPTIPGASPTPTPLPDYMTAPPFTCEQYADLGRPISISNILCGVGE